MTARPPARRVAAKVARTAVGTVVPSEEGSASRWRNSQGELGTNLPRKDYDPSFPMPDERHETFCACIAEGHTPSAASRTAGMTESWGYRLLNDSTPLSRQVKARVAVLRHSAVSVLPSAAALFSELHGVAKEAAGARNFKVAVDALKYLHAAKDRVERETVDADGQDVTTRLSETRVQKRLPARVVEVPDVEDEAAEEELRALAELDGMLGEDEGDAEDLTGTGL